MDLDAELFRIAFVRRLFCQAQDDSMPCFFSQRIALWLPGSPLPATESGTSHKKFEGLPTTKE
jgi:hypothetical protein